MKQPKLMQNPFISVIVPVYNAEKFLDKCVTSLLSQTINDFELLLVNDGSKDSSGQLCESFKSLDARIRVFHKSNGGVSSARNLGIKNAKGEFLCFVDSDDWVKEDFLANFGAKFCNADIYVQGYLQTSHMDSSIKKVGFSQSGYFQNLAPFEYGFGKILFNAPWGKLFSRHLVEEVGLRFDENLSYGEDTLFVLSYLCLIQSMCVSDQCSYMYQLRPNSLTYRFVDFYKLHYLANEVRRLHGQLIQKWKITSLDYLDAVNASFVSSFITSLNSLYHPKSSIDGHRRSVEFSKCVKFIHYNKRLFKQHIKTSYHRILFRLLIADFVSKEIIFCLQGFLRFVYLEILRSIWLALWQRLTIPKP